MAHCTTAQWLRVAAGHRAALDRASICAAAVITARQERRTAARLLPQYCATSANVWWAVSSVSGVKVVILKEPSSKKRDMKLECRHQNNIVAKSLMAKQGRRRGFLEKSGRSV
ncbi:hypothetical protein F511_24461 [Dorcoceras hygrometricum]|uniref:Uncharacterized protein n=1 Tax=Dorcoceras hygrometricum TaxID=472368 RepID=A0A2Z7AT72_9LAMI|nr:hypothetical protein F511_24461 [Dorcoceras hygrometricum]